MERECPRMWVVLGRGSGVLSPASGEVGEQETLLKVIVEKDN